MLANKAAVLAFNDSGFDDPDIVNGSVIVVSFHLPNPNFNKRIKIEIRHI